VASLEDCCSAPRQASVVQIMHPPGGHVVVAVITAVVRLVVSAELVNVPEVLRKIDVALVVVTDVCVTVLVTAAAVFLSEVVRDVILKHWQAKCRRDEGVPAEMQAGTAIARL
jgi:hypothetical protein